MTFITHYPLNLHFPRLSLCSGSHEANRALLCELSNQEDLDVHCSSSFWWENISLISFSFFLPQSKTGGAARGSVWDQTLRGVSGMGGGLVRWFVCASEDKKEVMSLLITSTLFSPSQRTDYQHNSPYPPIHIVRTIQAEQRAALHIFL